MINIAVIGGGISGLYSAYKIYKLLGKDVEITIYEKNKRLGGRIHTIKRHGLTYDAGAGRFSQNHTSFMKLIKELNITDLMIPMKGSKVYIKDSVLTKYDEIKIVNKLFQAAKTFTPQELKSQTMLMFMRQVLSPSDCDEFIYAFGYQSEFEQSNAWATLHSFKNDFLSTVPYYTFKGGMHTIVQYIHDDIVKKGTTICLDHTIDDVDVDKMIVKYTYHNQQKQKQFDKIIFCLTKPDLISLPSFIQKDILLQKSLDSTATRPLNRVYAQYPINKNGKVWFAGMSKICTNNALRQIIPVDVKNGLIMISYTDGIWADLWNQYNTNKRLSDAIMFHLRNLFPDLTIPEPIWVEKYHWDHAAHYPKSHHKQYFNTKTNYLVCGEVVTKNHNAWIEGAFRSVDTAFKLWKTKFQGALCTRSLRSHPVEKTLNRLFFIKNI